MEASIAISACPATTAIPTASLATAACSVRRPPSATRPESVPAWATSAAAPANSAVSDSTSTPNAYVSQTLTRMFNCHHKLLFGCDLFE